MCGRICCALCRETYQKASSYFNEKEGRYEKPNWKNISNGGLNFRPSTNLCPTDVSPVLVSGDHFNGEQTRQVLQPMMWQMIPRWHTGQYKSHGLSSNNCRLEGVTASKLYSPCLREGRRCVVVCEGFYEWKITGMKSKQPYLIYSPQPRNHKVENRMSWLEADWDEFNGWGGPKLLFLAGLFDIWKSEEDGEIYSYSVITMDSGPSMSWCHERMPAVLTNAEIVEAWLDFEGVPPRDALALLKPAKVLAHHPVSPKVSNSRNKNPGLSQPIKLNDSSSNMMSRWLKSGFSKRDLSPKQESPTIKKMKTEPGAESDVAKVIKSEPGAESDAKVIKSEPGAESDVAKVIKSEPGT